MQTTSKQTVADGAKTMYFLTPTGRKALNDKLHSLHVERKELLKLIKVGTDQQSSDPFEILPELQMLQRVDADLHRITALMHRAIPTLMAPEDGAALGSRIKLLGRDTLHIVTLVESIEADPSQGLISVISPLGKALIGRNRGDTVTVEAAGGTKSYRVMSVR